jgi:2-iminoacetate synthase
MSVRPIIDAWPLERLLALYENIRPADVEAALRSEERSLPQLAALLSPRARPYLEVMAREAQRLTRWHFGRTISLYAPIYISNLCASDCVYCGFAARSGSREKRTTLSPDEIRSECEALAGMGYQTVLLLTGEAPKVVSAEYIAEAVSIAREYFTSVNVEIYAMDEAEYGLLCRHGLDGVTLYMETYHLDTYREVHLLGRKMDYQYRLDASERAGRAEVRRLGLGVLLGLFNWRLDALWMALHARYLQKTCWQSTVSISFPRLVHTPARFAVRDRVTQADLAQIMIAMRLFLPESPFYLSTREPAAFRDRLIHLGATSISAGSSTRPGGYATHRPGGCDGEREVLEQFTIEDTRSVDEVVAMIRRAGLDPIWKDFDHAFLRIRR